MKDTRETLVSNMPHLPRVVVNNEDGEDIPEESRPPCRFKVGDVLIMAARPNEPFVLDSEPYWDYEFSGWLLAPGCIGIHECNYILASEGDQWAPHAASLWSWWERKLE